VASPAKPMKNRPDHYINRIGLTVVYVGELLRHRAYTRFLHWAYGIFFFLALVSGFAIYLPWIFRWFTPLFGGGAMTRLLHPWFGMGFVFFFALQAINWASLMTWGPGDTNWIRRLGDYVTHRDNIEPPDTGFFNAGQKLQFWEIVWGSVAFVVTGVIMWFPEIFGRIAVAISYVIHDISALIMLAGIFVHIYLSTIGEPGTMQSMTRGTVSEAWAWTHHPAWYKEVTGRDPEEALNEAAAKMQHPPDTASTSH
jgi:formate dehydrogenase subunit gamma